MTPFEIVAGPMNMAVARGVVQNVSVGGAHDEQVRSFADNDKAGRAAHCTDHIAIGETIPPLEAAGVRVYCAD